MRLYRKNSLAEKKPVARCRGNLCARARGAAALNKAEEIINKKLGQILSRREYYAKLYNAEVCRMHERQQDGKIMLV